MARGVMAGGTDYSDQSFEDIKLDLHKWRDSIREVALTIQEIWVDLEPTAAWEELAHEFKAVLARILKLLDTAYGELGEVLEDLEEEVRADHVLRLRRLGEQADKLNQRIGQIRNRFLEYDTTPSDEEQAWQVESMYGEARGMMADMIDLANAADRLEDFVGRKQPRTLQLQPGHFGLGVDLRRAWRWMRRLWWSRS